MWLLFSLGKMCGQFEFPGKFIQKLPVYFQFVAIISSNKKDKVLHMIETKDVLCQFGWNWRGGSGEEVVNVFSFFTIISLWQWAWHLIWTNFNHLYLGMLYVKYGGTWLGDSEGVNMWKDIDRHLDRQTDI